MNRLAFFQPNLCNSIFLNKNTVLFKTQMYKSFTQIDSQEKNFMYGLKRFFKGNELKA